MTNGWTTRGRRWLGRLALAGLVLGPYFAWAATGPPSLFDDDLIRVGSLRRSPVAASLFRPFNEHVAPLFELVGWGAWWVAGQEVDRIAAAFRVTAITSAVLTALALGVLVRLELRSVALGWLAAGLFAWQTATSEVALWYSASSFGWAAASALGAVIAAQRAATAPTRRLQRAWLAGAALLALAGPLFSAVGVLAGPLAALRLILSRSDGGAFERDRAMPPVGWLAALTPLLGTLVFAGILILGPGRSAVAGSVRTQFDLGAAAWVGVQAPALVLVPALVGFDSLTGRLPDWLAVLGTVGLVMGIARLIRDRHDRATLALALGWMAGGYALAYGPRARVGDPWIFAVGRYHLFPMIGAILAIVTLLRAVPTPRWSVDRRIRGIAIGLGLLGLGVLGLGRFAVRWEAMAVAYRFPEQASSLRAALRLEAACRAEGVTLAQAIRIIPPTLPRWFRRPVGFHPLLYLFGRDGPDARRADDDAKARVFDRLTSDDREAIWQALDVRRSGCFFSAPPKPGERDLLFQSPGDGREWTAQGGLIFWREFDVRAAVGEVRAIGLRQGVARRQEVWWLGADGRWTTERSVFWEAPADRDWATLWLDLTQLPHWRGDWGRRIRLVRRDRPGSTHPAWPAASFLEVRVGDANPDLTPPQSSGR